MSLELCTGSGAQVLLKTIQEFWIETIKNDNGLCDCVEMKAISKNLFCQTSDMKVTYSLEQNLELCVKLKKENFISKCQSSILKCIKYKMTHSIEMQFPNEICQFNN